MRAGRAPAAAGAGDAAVAGAIGREPPARQNRGPHATVDTIIEMDGGARIVLVERGAGHPPPGWALPGGFVEAGERAAEAAVRESREETGLDVTLAELFHVYSDPKRDPRGIFTLGVVFIGRAAGTPVGGDDAAHAQAFPIDALPSPIAFDHGLIIADYRRYRSGHGRPPPSR